MLHRKSNPVEKALIFIARSEINDTKTVNRNPAAIFNSAFCFVPPTTQRCPELLTSNRGIPPRHKLALWGKPILCFSPQTSKQFHTRYGSLRCCLNKRYGVEKGGVVNKNSKSSVVCGVDIYMQTAEAIIM